jgi:hypothetical protein
MRIAVCWGKRDIFGGEDKKTISWSRSIILYNNQPVFNSWTPIQSEYDVHKILHHDTYEIPETIELSLRLDHGDRRGRFAGYPCMFHCRFEKIETQRDVIVGDLEMGYIRSLTHGFIPVVSRISFPDSLALNMIIANPALLGNNTF